MSNSDSQTIWTHAQIQDYLSGRLPSHQAHALERDMIDDPFLAASVEGYEESGLSLSMTGLNDKWKSRQASSDSSSQSRGKGRDFSQYMLVLGGVAFIGALLWTWKSHSELDAEMDRFKANQQIFRDLEDRNADSLAVLEIKLALPVPATEEIRPEEIRAEQVEIQEIQQNRGEVVKEGKELEPREGALTPITPLGHDTQQVIKVQNLVKPEPKVFYLSDLKLADYRKDYGNIKYLAGEWMSGTAARFERDQNKMTQIAPIHQVDYETIMAEAMAFYSARDYKSALIILNRIEKRHPDDLNAAFYGGLCYFNLSKWNKANVRLRRAGEHPRLVFDQESKWYLARLLLKQAEQAKAQIILTEIIEEGGFYAEKAKLLLPQR